MQPKSLFLIAGELSGDHHGAALMRALKQDDPALQIQGIGGPTMTQEGIQSLLPFDEMQVMGFLDVLKAYPKLRRFFYTASDAILSSKPDAVILIDYPGFNLRLARHLKKAGYQGKIIQYISPTVWAWGKGRIQTMEQSLDLLLTIYPFEKSYFSKSALRVEYVGNPMLEELSALPKNPGWRQHTDIPAEAPLIALFPGSRPKEIERNLPLQIASVQKLMQENPRLKAAVSLKEPLPLPEGFYRLPPQYNYDCMEEAQGAVAKSGTITLELALKGVPTVVTYPLPAFNYYLAKYLFRISLPHYCISNILLNETLFPEWIDRKLDSTQIARSLKEVIAQNHFPQKAAALKALLGPQQASHAAAEKIMECING